MITYNFVVSFFCVFFIHVSFYRDVFYLTFISVSLFPTTLVVAGYIIEYMAKNFFPLYVVIQKKIFIIIMFSS